MEIATQAILIIATFSLAHERVVEFLRWWIDKLPWLGARNALDGATRGGWAWLPAVALSLATNANLIDAFRIDDNHQQIFFAGFLDSPPHGIRAIVGCCLMGLAVTLGSSFWHDLAQALIDMRGKLQNAKVPPQPRLTPATAQNQLAQLTLKPVPPAPAAPGIVPG